jgi:hypothetical protein
LLKESAPKGGVDEPRSAPPAWAGERCAPGWIRKERVGERDRVARADPEAAATAEVVDRPRDYPEAHAVQFAQEGRDLARQRSVHERLEEDGFGAVLTLVHRDELAEYRVRGLTAGAPPLDAADQALRPSAQRRVDKTFLCWCVKVDRAWSDVRAARHLADAQLRVSAAGHLAQGRGLDGARRSRRSARALALNVSTIHYRSTVAE